MIVRRILLMHSGKPEGRVWRSLFYNKRYWDFAENA